MNEHTGFDVTIVGGGIMGSSTAYHLTKMNPALKVAVVERDPTYARASTTLSMSNVRIQFALRENIQISKYAMQVLQSFEEDMEIDGQKPRIYYHREGNLFLINEEIADEAKRSFDLQQSLGCRVEWWSPDQIKERFPLYDSTGFIAGTFGPDDGHFDAYAALMAYKAKARKQGAMYLTGEAVRIMQQSGRVQGVQLESGDTLKSQIVIGCGGAWTAELAKTAGVILPVIPVKRQVFALDVAVKPQGPLPLTILPSGLYFRTETGGVILIGKSMPEDTIGFNFSWDEQRFNEILWPELAEFVPAWDRLKLVRGWAGLYDVSTIDGNAIIGEWPEVNGLYLATGFSGHGLQQGPAVGRYLSELVLSAKPSIDLSIFGAKRIIENCPIVESNSRFLNAECSLQR